MKKIDTDVDMPVVPKKSKAYYFIAFCSLLAAIMQSLDSTIANVALPYIQGSLSATQEQMSWVLTSYIVSSAVMIPLSGWLAVHFGRKRVFLFSIFTFTMASILCGMAQNLTEMVLFRCLQGLCGAALIPLSQSILFSINQKKDYGKAMAIWGVGITMGPILGPLLGGWLTDVSSWRWIFYINIPIAIVALVGLYLYLPETELKKSRFDFFGFFTLSLFVGALQIFLDRGETKDWFDSPEVMIECIVAGLSLYLFLVHTFSSSEERSILNIRIFQDRNFAVATLLMFIVAMSFYATLALLPPMLQNQFNYPIFLIGVVTAPRGVGAMLGMIIVGQMITKVDSRVILLMGFICMAVSLWQMTQYSLYMGASVIVYTGMIQGFGIGLLYIAISSIAFSTLSTSLQNEGTSFFNLLRSLGGSIGISVVETLLTRNTQIMHSSLAEHITPYNTLPDISQKALEVLNSTISNQAVMIAYIDDYYFLMILGICFMPLLFLLKKSGKTKAAENVYE